MIERKRLSWRCWGTCPFCETAWVEFFVPHTCVDGLQVVVWYESADEERGA